MMTDFNGGYRRQSPNAEERRAATALARPYLSQFEGWNKRAAYIGASMLARRSSEEQRTSLRGDIDALLEEVEASQTEFELAVASAPRHGRLDDVRNAFGRLVTTLRGGL